MRIDDGLNQRLWREAEDAELWALRRHGSEPAPAEPQPAPAPEAAAPAPFWAATPAPPNTLNELPPAPAAPASPPPPAPPPAYVGERAVDAAWLAEREHAFTAVRQDYEAARAAATASNGAGPGWTAANVATDESGRVFSTTGGPLVQIVDANAQPELIGWDEGGPLYRQPQGQWLAFDEAAFAAHYRSQGGAPLQTLARLYDSDAATLLAQHPEIWSVATQDHALNAGPPPAGRAMGDAGQLGMLDLYLADPQIQSLIDSYGGSVAPPSGALAQEQVRIYGAARYEQLSRLSNAMQAVREQYTNAMAAAQGSGGPGWVERQRTVTFTDESGAAVTQAQLQHDESGAATPIIERVFDPDAFTAWYVGQPRLANEAFASFYGRSHTQFGSDESGRTVATSITFDNPNWNLYGVGGVMAHKDLVRLDPDSPPELNDPNAVGFDLEAGWATLQSNIHQDRDWFETVVQVAIIAAVSYVSAGSLGPAAAGALGMTTTAATGATVLTAAGVVVSAAVAGAATSVVSGMMSGNLTFKGVLQGALAGGLSAGLMNGLGGAVRDAAGAAGTIALRTTVQGGIQALLGGNFKDGAIAGFAGGLADLAGANLQRGIDKSLADGTMSASEAMAARTMARVVTSAIRAAGNPDDPSYGFASALLGDLVQQAGTPAPVTQTAFDDDGNLMPGIVDSNASWTEQMAAVRAHLLAQGLDGATADRVVADYTRQVLDDAAGSFLAAQPQPVLVAGNGWTPQVRTAREVIDDVERRIADGALQGREIGYAIEDSYQAYLNLAAGVERSGLPPTVDDERAASRLIGLIGDLGQLARDQGFDLSPDQQRLVQQSLALQWQRSLPEIYGASAAGGILALRQSQRLQALEAWAAKPNLRHPDATIGRSDGGPGQWVYTGQRSAGADFQEQVSGVPRGIEYRIKDVSFDAFDPAARVVVDSKDWVGYPPPGTTFWQRGTADEAMRQLQAIAGTGLKLEWHVSTAQAAEEIRAALAAAARQPGLAALRDVIVTVVPRKGP